MLVSEENEPNESYSDSKQANLTGVFENSVDKVFTNDVRPQENDNRTDTTARAWLIEMGLV